MQTTNQKPAVLSPFFKDDISVDITQDILKDYIKTIFSPIYEPLVANQPMSIQDDKGNDITIDDLVDDILILSSDQRQYALNDKLNDIFEQTLVNFKKGLNATSVFVSQANGTCKMPEPSAMVIYTVDDIKQACKHYMADRSKVDELIVNFSFLIPQPCIFYTFLTDNVYQEFLAFVAQTFATMSGNPAITADVTQKMNDVQNIKLNLIEGIKLRNAQSADADNAYSFERIFAKICLEFAKSNDYCEILAPYVDELLLPANIIFVNVERVAKARNTTLLKAINEIKDGLTNPLIVLSKHQISKLSTLASAKKHMIAQMQNLQNLNSSNTPLGKRARFKFRKQPRTKTEYAKILRNIILKEGDVTRSQNYVKQISRTPNKANRRNPENPDLFGTYTKRIPRPDIHIYLDTSGSISEENYRMGIMTCIRMAKKLNINLYFNSFSHVLSSCTRLKCENKTTTEIYKEFLKINKVGGGTDYEQIWKYINKSNKRKREISLIISDFEYTPPASRFEHPMKLYYIPIDTSKWMYSHIINEANRFCQNMYHVDKNIRKKILI